MGLNSGKIFSLAKWSLLGLSIIALFVVAKGQFESLIDQSSAEETKPKTDETDELKLPEFAGVEKVGENEILYTIYNYAPQKKAIESLNLKLQKDTTVAINGLGLILNGELYKPGEIKPNVESQYLEISYLLRPKINKDRIPDITNIYINPLSPFAQPTADGLQSMWQNYCELRKGEHGLFIVYDKTYDVPTSLCGRKPNTKNRAFADKDNFAADTVIECREPHKVCAIRFTHRIWNISATFNWDKLHRWQDIRADLLNFITERSIEEG